MQSQQIGNYSLEISEDGADELISQLNRREFEDLKGYRLYQKSILIDLSIELGYKDIDFLVNQDDNLPSPEDYSLKVVEDEEWKREEVYRVSSKLLEEARTYHRIIEKTSRHVDRREKPESSNKITSGIKMKKKPPTPQEPAKSRRPTDVHKNDTSRVRDDFNDVKGNWKVLRKALEELPEQTELDYADTLREIEKLSEITID